MKKLIFPVLFMTAVTIFTACKNSSDESGLTEPTTTCETTVTTTTETTTTSETTTTVTTTETTSELATAETTAVTPSQAELNEEEMLNNIENVNYNGGIAIPRVAWTEINLDKIMYATEMVFGYAYASPGALAKVVYDPGAEVKVIGRTSTEYYRISGDYYIPCEKLSGTKPEGISVATSQTIAGVITAATVSGSWTPASTQKTWWTPSATTTTGKTWWTPTTTTTTGKTWWTPTTTSTAKTWWTPAETTAPSAAQTTPAVTTVPQ